MPGFSRQAIVVVIIAVLIAVPLRIMAASESQGKAARVEADSMVLDALLVRPLGIVATVAGLGLFVVSAPFSLLGRNAGQAWENMVVYPASFTFVRPLGDFGFAKTPDTACRASENAGEGSPGEGSE